MRASTLGYLFKEGFKSIWLNKLMSFASVGVLTACLILIGSSVAVSLNINHLVEQVADENEVVAFVSDFDAQEAEAKTAALEEAIKNTGNIESYSYVSKQQALEDQRAQLGDDAILLDGFDEDNPYPAHFVIKVADLEVLSQTVASISEIEGIYRVNSADNLAQTLVGIQNAVQVAGMIVFVALVLVSLVIISNTVRLTVFSRRREINIMKMVGATNRFIRTPFMIEGLILGLLAAIVSFAAIWGAYTYIYSWLHADVSLQMQQFQAIMPFEEISTPLLVGFLVAGVTTGAFGSTLCMRKHLKV